MRIRTFLLPKLLLITTLVIANPSYVKAGGPILNAPIRNPILPLNLQLLSGAQFFGRLLPALINVGLVIGAVVFFFMLLLGAVQWISSGGDKGAVEAARGKITNALIGLVVLFSLYAIITLVGRFFGVNLTFFNLNVLKIG